MGQGIAIVDVFAEVEEQFQIQGALHVKKQPERQKINMISDYSFQTCENLGENTSRTREHY
jgi:hypothetical protein